MLPASAGAAARERRSAKEDARLRPEKTLRQPAVALQGAREGERGGSSERLAALRSGERTSISGGFEAAFLLP